jgi:hypothetical protein
VSPPSADAREAAGRIESWLLGSPAQLPDGGVAGRVDDAGRPEYVYLEITGYYGTAAAWLGARERAAAAAAWTRTATAGGALPTTRIHLTGAEDDWRNEAVFTFDLAMAARGAAHGGASDVARVLAERVAAVSGEAVPLASHSLVAASAADLEARWSTRPGPHHLKAAAALLTLPKGALPDPLAAACRATVDHWGPRLREPWPVRELHPLLYGVEGLLILGMDEAAEPALARLLALQEADGSLPAAADGSGGVRADVLAQALRAGAILDARGRPSAAGRLDALADALLRHVRADGGVRFSLDQPAANTWCAMFAQQALALHARAGDRALADRAARLLV